MVDDPEISPPPFVPRRRRPRETLAEKLEGKGTILTAAGIVGLALASALAAKLESCAAKDRAAAAAVQATATQVQATTTQVRQERADFEGDVAYRALEGKADVLAGAVEELTRAAKEAAERIARLEAGAGRRVRAGDEAAAPDVDIEEVTAPLPASPAAAAAAATTTRRKP